MDHNLEKLYSTLGYRGPLPNTSANTEVSESGTVFEAAVVQKSTDPAEIPPLDPEGLRALEIELKRNPDETLTRAREVIDKNLTEEELRTLLSQADMALSSPETAVPAIEAEAFHMEKAIILPEAFGFPGMDLEEIPINAGDHKFETVGDALGWVIHAGPFILTKASKDNFRWHSRPDFANSQFIYSLPEPTDNSPLNIALFSDFGNGRYHGGGLKVAEDAAIDDGKLDLYLIYPCRLWQLATSLIHLKFGISEPAVLKRLTAVSVSLRTYRPRPVDADGELVTKTPTQFELHPKALTEIVPHKRPLDSSI